MFISSSVTSRYLNPVTWYTFFSECKWVMNSISGSVKLWICIKFNVTSSDERTRYFRNKTKFSYTYVSELNQRVSQCVDVLGQSGEFISDGVTYFKWWSAFSVIHQRRILFMHFFNCRDDFLLKLLTADMWLLKVCRLKIENVVPPRFSPWKIDVWFLSHKLTQQMFLRRRCYWRWHWRRQSVPLEHTGVKPSVCVCVCVCV